MAEELVGTPEVCRRTGASYRQVDYWVRTGVLCPSVEARGSGTQRAFSRRDVEVIRALVLLRELGISGLLLRRVAAALVEARAQWEAPALISGEGRVLPLSAISPVAMGWVIDLPAVREYVREKAAERRGFVAA